MTSSVLVVEDEPLIRMEAVDMFEEAGLTVVDFADGASAADYLKAHEAEIAAIFTDINLKGEVDGVQLSKFAARIAPEIVLVVTSGRYVDRPDRLPQNARFMSKPWVPVEVLQAVQRAVVEHERSIYSIRR